jgi:hypothetical protein
MQILCSGFSKILDGLLYSYLHPLSVADEVTGWWWQLITTIHDGGDGLTLCEWLSQDYDLHLLLYCLQIVVLEISFLISIMLFAQSLICFYKVGVVSDSHYALTLSFLLMMYDLDAKFTTSSSRVVWVSFALNHGLSCVWSWLPISGIEWVLVCCRWPLFIIHHCQPPVTPINTRVRNLLFEPAHALSTLMVCLQVWLCA